MFRYGVAYQSYKGSNFQANHNGHRSIATMQIYGKIVDERRRTAVSLLDGIVGD